MPKLDLSSIPATNATDYPPPLDAPVHGRWYRRLGQAAGLADFAASHVTLQPGAWSSHRHVHASDDELLVMLAGEAVLVEDEGRTVLRAGDCVAWPKNGTAHQLINESDAPCTFVAISPARYTGDTHYPDVDMHLDETRGAYLHHDGLPY